MKPLEELGNFYNISFVNLTGTSALTVCFCVCDKLISGGDIDTNPRKFKWLDNEVLAKIETAYRNKQRRSNKDTGSLVYLGEYNKQDIRDEIQDKLFHDSERISNHDPAIGFSGALVVNETWTYVKIVVPYAAYFHLRLRENNSGEALKGSGYKEFKVQLEQRLQKGFKADNISISELIFRADELIR